jgi:deoxyribonuclease-4
MRIGVHNSTNGGILNVIKEVDFLKTNATQFFIHSPRIWDISEIKKSDKEKFRDEAKKLDIFPVVVHSSYLINPLSKNNETVEKSKKLLKLEIENASEIADYYVLHIKENKNDGLEENIKNLIKFFKKSGLQNSIKILFENPASGLTSEIKNLLRFYKSLRNYSPVSGLCIDTAHIYESGYNIRIKDGVNRILDEIKDISIIKLIHLNDSKTSISSHTDRHCDIGKGRLGIDGFENFFSFKELNEIPLILETPKKTLNDDKKNLKVVRKILSQKILTSELPTDRK